jgi:biopolymer transport protein ExbB
MKDLFLRLGSAVLLGVAVAAPAGGAPGTQPGSRQDAAGESGGEPLEKAADSLQKKLARSQQRLSDLRDRISDKKVPLTKKIDKLERTLRQLRETQQAKSRKLDSRTLELNNLRSEIKTRRTEAKYLQNLLSEYRRNFSSRLHIAERARHQKLIQNAKQAAKVDEAGKAETFRRQTKLVKASMTRLEEALGGTRFEGKAVGPDGVVQPGRFLLLGPVALFRGRDGALVGTAAEQLNASEPTVRPFAKPAQAKAAKRAMDGRGERVPVDPTLGKAHKVEQTRAGLWAHIQKGGPVMVPIFALAGASLLVALYKWLALSFTRKPSQKRLDELMRATRHGAAPAQVQSLADALPGPAGRMLARGAAHVREPRELIEEVMYEHVLDTRLKLNRFLPFVAITAASAPLLGLLGTVTGIINTFELITAFGTGDVQTLSGGISEALVTTEFGLIVAIPSLLLHAFLSRKARGITDQMEKAAVAFTNEIMHGRSANEQPTTAEAA